MKELPEFRRLPVFESQIVTSAITSNIFEFAPAANCHAYRSELLISLVFCEGNSVLSNFTLGYYMVSCGEYDHTFLVLYKKGTNLIEYIADPTFKWFQHVSSEIGIKNYILHCAQKDKRKMNGSYKIKQNKYCDFPVEFGRETSLDEINVILSKMGAKKLT